MASNATNDIDGSATQKSYPKDYKILMRITASAATYNVKNDWMLSIVFRCHDLLQIMREGLFWTTSNVVPERGWLSNTTGPDAAFHPWQRVWELREFADRDEPQCRWVATVTLFAHSVESLANFRLHTLHRQNVRSAEARNKEGFSVFLYNCVVGGKNFNCFIDNLHPSHGSWWFWPMEAILDYDTLDVGGEKNGG